MQIVGSGFTQYGTGSVAFDIVNETVTMADIAIPNQAFGLATSYDGDLGDGSCDGLIVSIQPTALQLQATRHGLKTNLRASCLSE